MKHTIATAILALTSLASAAQTPSPTPPPSAPETVIATFRVKPDKMDAFLALMPSYWAALRERNMVFAEPYVLMRGTENGKPIVIEVFTWRSGDTPDNAPTEIQAYWDKFNAMVEARDGHQGIEFPVMTLLTPAPQQAH
jgi:quinol monooxygenase YgiN